MFQRIIEIIMIRGRPFYRPFLLAVLTLLFCGTTAFAETWEPVSTGFSTDIVITTSASNRSAEVRLTCPNTGYRVTDWGTVVRTDNEFAVDAKVERWTGVSAQMIMTISHVYALGALPPGTYSFVVKAYGTVMKRQSFTIATTASPAPRLLTEETTERAIAVESVTLLRGPFPFATTHQFSSDGANRVMLFATDMQFIPGEGAAATTVQAEDSQGKIYPVTVEYVGKPTNLDQLVQLIIKLPAEVENAGDIWLSVNVRGVISNKVLISIKLPNN
jgi:hypothetical protein